MVPEMGKTTDGDAENEEINTRAGLEDREGLPEWEETRCGGKGSDPACGLH